MTKREVLKNLERLKISSMACGMQSDNPTYEKAIEALNIAITALRGPTREQVERMRGEWVIKHRHHGGFHRVTGVDDTGEQHTITIDERCEYDDLYCSKCGKQSPDNFLDFCGCCGAPMTDEAVDIVMQRLEALKDEID